MFFSKRGQYQASGLFSLGHFILLGISISLIILFFRYYKDKEDRTLLITRVIAILITSLEIIKISFNILTGATFLDAWVPLSFCSIFIYATIFSSFNKGFLKKTGDIFIIYGAAIAGAAYLIFPTTSLTIFPAFHFQSLHSFLFHSLMVFLSLLYMYQKDIPNSKTTYRYYGMLVVLFIIASLILNIIYDSNLMMLMYFFGSDNKTISDFSESRYYSSLVMMGYLSIYYINLLIYKLCKKLKQES